MIDKILESNFKKLNSLYGHIFEEIEVPDLMSQYDKQRANPSYLYSELERYLRDPKIGIYLSPARFLEERSVWLKDMYAEFFNQHIKDGMDEDEAKSAAERQTEQKIKSIIKDHKEKLRRENPEASEDEINAKTNRDLPLATNNPSFEMMDVNSQRYGDQAIFMGVKGDNYLEMSRDVVRSYKSADVWHDPNISKMVVFGNGTSVAPRTQLKLDKLIKRKEAIDNEVERLKGSEDPAEKAELAIKNGDLRRVKSKINMVSTGSWRPVDINELIYGSKKPPLPLEVDVKKSKGLIPDFYYRFGGDAEERVRSEKILGTTSVERIDEQESSYISRLIDDVDDSDGKEKSRLKRLRKEWQDNNGDFRNISSELYTIALQYASTFESFRDAVGIMDLNHDSKTNGLDTITIGGMKYAHKDKKWVGKELEEPELNVIRDVDVESKYSMDSIRKRLYVAQMLAQSIDSSIYQWVINKVGDLVRPDNTGLLNIGSDPSVVNHFICSIDQTDSRNGVDARISWLLIPFINMHKEEANKYFSNAKSITKSYAGMKDKNGSETISFEDFSNWSSGVFNYNKVIVRDKSGRPIDISGHEFDDYVNLAILIMSENDEINLDNLDSDTVEIDLLSRELENLIKIINELNDKIGANEEAEGANEEAERANEKIEGALAIRRNKLIEKQVKIQKKIYDLEKHTNDSWAKIIRKAETLQEKGPSVFRSNKLYNKTQDAFDDDEFEKWAKETGNDKEIAAARKNYQESPNKKEAQTQLQLLMHKLQQEFRNNESEEINTEISELSDDDKEIIKSLIVGPYANHSYGDIAKIASKKVGRKITPDQVGSVAATDKIDRSKGDVASFMVNTLKKMAKDAGTDDKSITRVISDMARENDDVKCFIRAIAETITSQIELSIVKSSQTKIYKGGGSKTDLVYKDEHGVLNTPLGWDLDEPYGKTSNPYDIIKRKKEQIKEKKEEIENSTDEIKIKEYEEEIRKILISIEAYQDYINSSNTIQELSDRSYSVAGVDNPLLPKNKEILDKLITKMESYIDGDEEIQWETYRDEESGAEFSELEMIEFLHNHIPLMQSMGLNVARISCRYIIPVSHSKDQVDEANRKFARNKDLTDLGAAQNGALLDLVDIINARGLFHNLNSVFKEHGLDKALSDISVPIRSIEYLTLQLAIFASNSKMRGGLHSIEDAELAKKFIKSKLIDLCKPDSPEDEINNVIHLMTEQLIELSTPTEQDIEMSKKVYSDIMPILNDILNGTEALTKYENLPYNPSDMQIVFDLVETIRNMRDGNYVDEDKLKQEIDRFTDFSDQLVANKESEEVFSECLTDMANVDRLDNLNYLIKKRNYMEELAEDGFEYSESDFNETEKQIADLIAELDDRGIKLDSSNSYSMLISISNFRENIKSRIESRITHSNHAELSNKLYEFDNIINASFIYHGARSDLYEAVNDEEKAEAEETIKETHRDIIQFGKSLGLSMPEFESNAAHRFTTSEIDEFASQYKERQDLYDRIIHQRENIVKSNLTPLKTKEEWISICRRLAIAAKQYNISSKKISNELLDYFDQFKSTAEFKEEERRAVEKALGGIELEVTMSTPNSNEKIKAKIYPRQEIYDRFKRLVEHADFDATVLNPDSLINNGKSNINIQYEAEGRKRLYNSPEIEKQIRSKLRRINNLKLDTKAYQYKNEMIKKLENEIEKLAKIDKEKMQKTETLPDNSELLANPSKVSIDETMSIILDKNNIGKDIADYLEAGNDKIIIGKSEF